jgi:putative selenate reductase
LDRLARARGKRLAVKFSNTLVVKNHRTFFADEVMYMSGAPLHVLTLNLVQKFRQHVGAAYPTSFSAGLDSNNMADCVAMNFIPATTCTDLLRPGGYARLIRYMEKLGDKMKAVGAGRLPDFVVRHAGQGLAAVDQVTQELKDSLRAQFVGAEPGQLDRVESWFDTEVSVPLKAWVSTTGTSLNSVCHQVAGRFEEKTSMFPSPVAAALRRTMAGLEQSLVDAAGVLNTPVLVKQATENPRYRWESNKGVPRKIGSKLWLYDCINCDKCVPVCPNVANFVYETTAVDATYDNFELTPDGPPQRVPGGVFKVAKAHQLASYADACNDCGNCDVFCPEDGGPYIEKPRFFGSLETYRKYAGRNGFYIAFEGKQTTIYGTIAGASYQLRLNPLTDNARFEDLGASVEIRPSSGAILSWELKPATANYTLDMRPYLQLKLLAESVGNARHVNFANVAGL